MTKILCNLVTCKYSVSGWCMCEAIEVKGQKSFKTFPDISVCISFKKVDI